MTQRNDWFNSVFVQFIKEAVIKLQSFLTRRCFVAFWKDPAPGNRCAEALKPKFRKKSDIFPIRMVKINAGMVRITFPFYNAIRNPPWNAMRASRLPADARLPLRPIKNLLVNSYKQLLPLSIF